MGAFLGQAATDGKEIAIAIAIAPARLGLSYAMIAGACAFREIDLQ